MTRDERDRALVAQAGPWRRIGRYVQSNADVDSSDDDAAGDALVRIANRIVREERGKRK